jgi:hypothetical protein
MKPAPLARTSFGSRIGSPAMNGRARDRAGDLRRRRPGRLLRLMTLALGRRGGPRLPLHVVRPERLTERDITLGNENVGVVGSCTTAGA